MGLEQLRDVQRRRADQVGRLAVVGMLLLFGLVVGRIAMLQLMPSAALREHMQERVSRVALDAPRGDIVDARGRMLAGTRMGERVFVDPMEMVALGKDEDGAGRQARIERTVTALAGAIGMEAWEVADRLIPVLGEAMVSLEAGEKGRRYLSVGGVLDDGQAARVRGLAMQGVHLEDRPTREYPAGDSVAALLGLVGVDHTGLLGVEQRFDRALTAQAGSARFTRDSRGRPLWAEAGGARRAEYGSPVQLSIDLAIQEMAEEELIAGVERAGAVGGRLIMADPTTGEILAMLDYTREVEGLTPFSTELANRAAREDLRVRFATLPEKDPNRGDHAALQRNRCIEDVYEPGSTFKVFMWSAATELGLVDPSEVFDTHDGRWRTAYGRAVTDVSPKAELSWRDVLVYSSNIGMVQGCERLTPAQMRHGVTRFGFGAPTRVGLPGEASGILTSLKDWTKYTQTSLSMGYEVAVTPIQMVRAFSAFAREGELSGTLPSLRLTAATAGEVSSTLVERALPVDLAYSVREPMATVAERMLDQMRRYEAAAALEAGVEGYEPFELSYSMFGKSGTAEIHRPDGRGYLKRQHNSSFIAAAPLDQPQVVILVVIDDPAPELVSKRRHFGSAVAGPVAARVVQRTLDYLGSAPRRGEPAPE